MLSSWADTHEPHCLEISGDSAEACTYAWSTLTAMRGHAVIRASISPDGTSRVDWSNKSINAEMLIDAATTVGTAWTSLVNPLGSALLAVAGTIGKSVVGPNFSKQVSSSNLVVTALSMSYARPLVLLLENLDHGDVGGLSILQSLKMCWPSVVDDGAPLLVIVTGPTASEAESPGAEGELDWGQHALTALEVSEMTPEDLADVVPCVVEDAGDLAAITGSRSAADLRATTDLLRAGGVLLPDGVGGWHLQRNDSSLATRIEQAVLARLATPADLDLLRWLILFDKTISSQVLATAMRLPLATVDYRLNEYVRSGGTNLMVGPSTAVTAPRDAAPREDHLYITTASAWLLAMLRRRLPPGVKEARSRLLLEAALEHYGGADESQFPWLEALARGANDPVATQHFSKRPAPGLVVLTSEYTTVLFFFGDELRPTRSNRDVLFGAVLKALDTYGATLTLPRMLKLAGDLMRFASTPAQQVIACTMASDMARNAEHVKLALDLSKAACVISQSAGTDSQVRAAIVLADQLHWSHAYAPALVHLKQTSRAMGSGWIWGGLPTPLSTDGGSRPLPPPSPVTRLDHCASRFLYVAANVYFGLAKFSVARRLLTRLIEIRSLNPQSLASAYLTLSECCFREQDHRQALRHARTGLAVAERAGLAQIHVELSGALTRILWAVRCLNAPAAAKAWVAYALDYKGTYDGRLVQQVLDGSQLKLASPPLVGKPRQAELTPCPQHLGLLSPNDMNDQEKIRAAATAMMQCPDCKSRIFQT